MVLSSCAEKNTPQVGTATLEKSSSTEAGKTIYIKNCKVCHAQAINGAPILGNAAMWGPRIGQGEALLSEHAMNGFGLMPANLGRNGLTEEQIGEAVLYMLKQLD